MNDLIPLLASVEPNYFTRGMMIVIAIGVLIICVDWTAEDNEK